MAVNDYSKTCCLYEDVHCEKLYSPEASALVVEYWTWLYSYLDIVVYTRCLLSLGFRGSIDGRYGIKVPFSLKGGINTYRFIDGGGKSTLSFRRISLRRPPLF